ncbi:EAL domain-containing protein [Azonexus fungiphilus]|uniref:EAL domain-containing protein n=1 Tax=Azonexus fungiphilus TaxID=146940 RepID=UPI00156BCFBB|nr:EAL domain-containing protein [Azonexus fungiphilus]NHC08349.1 EAL domain-containing protein [Azonexus fungiphilus]
MTTTSARWDASFIDFAAFGLGDEELVSLRSLSDIWGMALREIRPQVANDPVLLDFLELTEELPLALADPAWQQHWVRGWHGLASRGYAVVEILRLFFAAVVRCEQELIGDRDSVGRVVLALFSCLRRAVLAAVSCALELGEEAQQEAAGLPGELAALRCLRELLTVDRQVGLLSVSVINRDSFAYIAASDLQRLPAMLAAHIAQRLRPDDRVFAGREGEWLVILPDVHAMSQPALAASHIGKIFEAPVVLFGGGKIMMQATVGAAMLPEHALDAEGALHAARLARWDAASRRQGFAWFDPRLGADWQQRYHQVESLREALQQEALALYLQPQVDLASGRCIGAELLLRWRGSDGAWMDPPAIIELIEENGWRTTYTDWLLRAAMRTAAELDAAGIGIGLACNLTVADMVDEELPELLGQCLETWQLPGSRFTLELTESALMADREQGLAIMRRLRALGCRLALDDFGTGYSSLSYLVSLPINEIKIDRSFIVGMLDSIDSLRIVSTIVDLARDLGMLPLAEGVEDLRQREQLLELGCAAAQGYLYAAPMPLDEFVAWFRARHP